MCIANNDNINNNNNNYACCVVVWLGLDLVSGWLVVMHKYYATFRRHCQTAMSFWASTGRKYWAQASTAPLYTMSQKNCTGKFGD